MRVIAGKYKRKKLITSNDDTIRPIMDRVKEYIFNVIQDWTDEAQVADIFAGSGSFGIEAISRGAKQVTFVDLNNNAIKAIEKNIASVKIIEPWRVVKQDAIEFVNKTSMKFDVVFCDPPYAMENFDTFIETLGKSDILAEDGILIIEHYSKNQLPETFGNLELYRDKKFGKTIISMYRTLEK